MSNYISSLINKYGDRERVGQDAKTLHEVLQRQGSSLLIDVIAEHAGETSNTFKLQQQDRQKLIESLVAELKNALEERFKHENS